MIDLMIRASAVFAVIFIVCFIAGLFEDAMDVVRNGLENDDEFNEDED